MLRLSRFPDTKNLDIETTLKQQSRIANLIKGHKSNVLVFTQSTAVQQKVLKMTLKRIDWKMIILMITVFIGWKNENLINSLLEILLKDG